MMKKKILISIVIMGFFGSAYAQITINKRYWQYKGQPVMLLGGWNHGHNPHIDHNVLDDNGSQGVSTEAEIKTAISELAVAGGNLLRCVLDPGMGAGIQQFNFCATSGDKYDLNDMTGPFWTRLDMFIAEAEAKGIVIQLEIWDRFDLIDNAWGSWPVSPFNPVNNVNYTTIQSGLASSYSSYIGHPFLQGVPGHPVYEAASAGRKKQYDLVRSFQEKFVDKLLSITLQYDNVLYCMNNETHENPKWGEYWIGYINKKAASEGKRILLTDMFDKIYQGVSGFDWQYQSTNLDTYDYIDVSQTNSRHRDQESWNFIIGMADDARSKNILLHMTKVYGNDLSNNGNPWGSWKPGDTDNGIEEWWRNLIAGVAGIRFHRPNSGIGISELAKKNIKSVRLIEEKIKFWDVEPHQELLGDRENDEAYLAANPGLEYILYFTAKGQGAVTLDLTDYSGIDFKLSWININSGSWDFVNSAIIGGGSRIAVYRPGPGHWVATIINASLDPKADQTITMAEITDKYTTCPPFDVAATASSGLDLTYSISGPASITGTTITLDGTVGTVTVTAFQAGNENFNPAATQQTFEVLMVTEVDSNALKVKNIYPNPAVNYIQVPGEYDSVKIISLSGTVVYRNSDNRKLIDVQSLPPGIYIVLVISKSGTKTFEFVKK